MGLWDFMFGHAPAAGQPQKQTGTRKRRGASVEDDSAGPSRSRRNATPEPSDPDCFDKYAELFHTAAQEAQNQAEEEADMIHIAMRLHDPAPTGSLQHAWTAAPCILQVPDTFTAGDTMALAACKAKGTFVPRNVFRRATKKDLEEAGEHMQSLGSQVEYKVKMKDGEILRDVLRATEGEEEEPGTEDKPLELWVLVQAHGVGTLYTACGYTSKSVHGLRINGVRGVRSSIKVPPSSITSFSRRGKNAPGPNALALASSGGNGFPALPAPQSPLPAFGIPPAPSIQGTPSTAAAAGQLLSLAAAEPLVLPEANGHVKEEDQVPQEEDPEATQDEADDPHPFHHPHDHHHHHHHPFPHFPPHEGEEGEEDHAAAAAAMAAAAMAAVAAAAAAEEAGEEMQQLPADLPLLLTHIAHNAEQQQHQQQGTGRGRGRPRSADQPAKARRNHHGSKSAGRAARGQAAREEHHQNGQGAGAGGEGSGVVVEGRRTRSAAGMQMKRPARFLEDEVGIDDSADEDYEQDKDLDTVADDEMELDEDELALQQHNMELMMHDDEEVQDIAATLMQVRAGRAPARQPGQRRARVKYSDDEINAILDGLLKLSEQQRESAWATIKRDAGIVLTKRSNVDLKDKWRNLQLQWYKNELTPELAAKVERVKKKTDHMGPWPPGHVW